MAKHFHSDKRFPTCLCHINNQQILATLNMFLDFEADYLSHVSPHSKTWPLSVFSISKR